MKQIKFSYNNQDYILEYTRSTVKAMEAQGFKVNEFDSMPATQLPMLFKGAFLSKHKFIKETLINEIFENMGNKELLFETLSEMYIDTVNSLFDEPEEGNVEWTIG